MRTLVLGASDSSHAPIGSHNDDRGQFSLESAIQEGEALDVEHMDLEARAEMRSAQTQASGRMDTLHLGLTSSMNNTPGTISALPSSRQSLTF